MTVTGFLLKYAARVLVDGQPVSFALNRSEAGGKAWIEFKVPVPRLPEGAVESGARRRLLESGSPAQIMGFTVEPDDSVPLAQSGSGAFLFSVSPCEPAEYEVDPDATMRKDRCAPCPEGGFCPGGTDLSHPNDLIKTLVTLLTLLT
jgi:hypothetical protein